MSSLKLEVVTGERLLVSEEVDMVVIPTLEGSVGILPRHTPLLSVVQPGLLKYRQGEKEEVFAVGGGFLEVNANKVIVLADAAERADEIDEVRAEAARQRALLLLEESKFDKVEFARAEAALSRSVARLKVAELKKKKGTRGPLSS